VKYGETILEAVLAVNEENVIKPAPEDCDEATYTITVKGLEKDTLYSFACSAKLPKGVDEDIPEAVNFVQIKTKGDVVTTTTETTTTTTPTMQTLPLGDPNGDGRVEAKDASFILVAYAKASKGGEDGLTDEQRAAADVNGDGRVDAKDASTVLAYYALISTATGEVPTLEEFARPKSKQ